MEEQLITAAEIKRMQSIVKKAGGPRLVLGQAGLSTDTYWNIVYGRSCNRDKMNLICNTGIDIIIASDDHAE